MERSDYWKAVRNRWRTVVITVGLMLGLAGFLTWQATPQYSSSARLFVATTESDASQAYQGGLFATQRVESYADIVPKSRKLADQVIADLGGKLEESTVMSEVSASVDPGTVNLVITATDPNPVQARDIAQAYAEALSALVTTLETPAGKTDALIRAQIVDDADVSTSPVLPKPLQNLGLAGLLGLVLGIALAIVRERMDNSVGTAEDVASITSAPVLGHITTDVNSVREPPGSALAGTSAWSEAFRVLRTNMQFIEVDQEQKVFVVTSSLPEEGKSTIAVNLAVTLAMTNQKVALVECDLRRPLIARRLGMDGAVGTTSVLIGQVSLREALQTHGGSGLRVLACGPIPPNPSELLQSKAMATLLNQLRAEFDIVLLDAPPLLPVTDAALLAAQTDGAMLVVHHGHTTKDQLAHSTERLQAVDARSVGVVFNMVPARRRAGGAYSYSYGYSYGYKSREEDLPVLKGVQPTQVESAAGREQSTGGRA